MATTLIMLVALLHLSDDELENTKIRLNRNANGVNLLEEFKRDSEVINVGWLLHRISKRYFHAGQYVICLARISDGHWLLIAMKTVTNDFNLIDGVLYKSTEWEQFALRCDCVIMKYHSAFQQAVSYAKTLMGRLEVLEVLSENYNTSIDDRAFLQREAWWNESRARRVFEYNVN